MASMTLISFTAYGSEQSDQDQILKIAERIAALQGIYWTKYRKALRGRTCRSWWRI